MMTAGRLQAIRSQHGRGIEGTADKHRGELIDEVDRLRGILAELATAESESPLVDMARAALKEPQRDWPDFICRRSTVREGS